MGGIDGAEKPDTVADAVEADVRTTLSFRGSLEEGDGGCSARDHRSFVGEEQPESSAAVNSPE